MPEGEFMILAFHTLVSTDVLKFHGNINSLEPTSAYISEIWFHNGCS